MPDLRLPDRLSLARLPTPVERLNALSAELGVSLLVKRDDLTGMPMSGNKIRKLEFVLAEAKRRDSTDLLSTGGVQSNHCRAVAVAARRLGLQPHLLLRTPDGRAPGETDGNLLLNFMLDADIRYINPAEYEMRDILLGRWADELTEAGRRPYVIPEGASNALGSLGYFLMVKELEAQLQEGRLPGNRPPDFLVHACGSGGTAAGLAAGLTLHPFGPDGARPRLVSYSVCDDEATFRARIDGIISDLASGFLPTLDESAASYDLVDAYRGEGYALSTPAELRFIREIARAEGLLLDPVYTGKAFRGMVEEIRLGSRYPQGSTILFVHTGGLFGLFPKRAELLAALEPNKPK
ncbi:MAG: D-cysteine desulfhydrase family protein [Polyangia bacterium]|jgi:D-cysteine desulfhydrase|nr:D-cysteine desulfhydrase family protein [Polyangia bacterium]